MPSLADVVFVGVLALVLLYGVRPLLNSDGDTARHLAVGRQIIVDRAIPLTDFFSHTKGGEPFVPYEWLSEVVFALADQVAGLAGVAVLAAALIALPFLLLTRWMVRDGISVVLALMLVAAGALASSVHWLARPHLFSILLALLWARSLSRFEATGSLRYLAVLPASMVLWVNLHPGFLSGFILLGIFFVSNLSKPRRAAQIAVAGIASLVATLINPVGIGLWQYVLGYLQLKPFMDQIQEFKSPNFHDPSPQIFMGLVLLALTALALTPRRVRATDLLLLLPWTYLGVYAVRNIAIFVVVCLPVVGRLVQQAVRSTIGSDQSVPAVSGRPRGLAALECELGRPLIPVVCAGLALVTLLAPVSAEPRSSVVFDPATFPVEALSKADSLGVQGNLFNYYTWGGYVLYAGHDKYPVFVDGQTDHYGVDLVEEYQRVWQVKPDWEEILDRHSIGWMLIPHQAALSLMLRKSQGWKLGHEDATADLFVRAQRGLGPANTIGATN